MSLVALIFTFLFGFGFTLGPVVYVYLPEILPESGVGVASFVNWLGSSFVAFVFPIILSFDIVYCFGLFACFNLIGYFPL